MRRIILRNALILVSLVAPALAGGLVAAEQIDPASREAEIAQVRETLVDLLVSERIVRVDFQAETYDQAMDNVHATVDAILVPNLSDYKDLGTLAKHAGQVIEAFNAHKPRGVLMTFGRDVQTIPVRNPTEARMLGELFGNTLALINDQFSGDTVSYRDRSRGLFRSVTLDAEEGPYLTQYLDGIQIVADLPRAQRTRYFR